MSSHSAPPTRGRLWSESPYSTPPIPLTFWKSLVWRMQAKDYEGALGYLAHARDLAPDNPRIHFLFAMTAIKMNLPVEARRSLERALALDPANPGYNYAMGSVVLTTRDAATASSYFQNFVKAEPADPQGHYALGIAYFASGDYAQAKQEMRPLTNDPKRAA